RDRERPRAEHEPPGLLGVGERLRGRRRELPLFEQGVVDRDRVGHARTASLIVPFSTCFHQRCSSRHGGAFSPSAYEITRSVIFSSTQRKLSSLMEKLSKSGAGLRKSMA